MFDIICCCIALVFLGVAFFFAVKNRFEAKKCISSIMIGILVSTMFMVLPTEWVKEGKTVFAEIPYAIVSSLLYALKAISGRQDISQLESIGFEGVCKGIYIAINYVLFMLAPVITSSLIISCLGDTFDKLKYTFCFSSKYYVFSELNENALTLADSISKKEGRKKFVFCNTKKCDEGLITKARKRHAILLYGACDNISLHKNKKYRFYLVSADEDKNIENVRKLLKKHTTAQENQVIVYAFVESGTSVNILESESKGTNIELRCIDEIALFCNYLIYQHPLYELPKDHQDISVAIVGCGRTGMRMLKTVVWAGHIIGHELKIRIYDKEAEQIEGEFSKQCPEFKNAKFIKFIQVDVETDAFHQEIIKEDNSGDATYIVVAMGDDQLNLSIADELHGIYRRRNHFDIDSVPKIFARIRSNTKSNNYFSNNEFLDKRKIHLFGTTEHIFAEKTLLNTEFEHLSLAVHLVYNNCFEEEKKDTKEYNDAIKDFRTSEYSRRSSMAAALHIPAKEYMKSKLEEQGEEEEKIYNQLYENEHERWNAFMMSEGHQSVSVEEMKEYIETTGSHREKIAKLHPCITSWEQLNELEMTFKNEFNIDKEFKKKDIEIVNRIPEIIAKGKQFSEGEL